MGKLDSGIICVFVDVTMKMEGIYSPMNILRQVGILAALCWLCHIVEDGLPFGFPASVIGMLALFILLAAGILKRAQIGEISDRLSMPQTSI